jgi:hypothetical protein
MAADTLGTFVLPSGLVMTDDSALLHVRQTLRQTLHGEPVVFAGRALRGITLTGGSDHGWLPLPQLSTLLAMAASGSDYELHAPSLQHPIHARVIFDHSRGSAVTWQPIYPGAPYVIPTIRLLILEDI